MWAVSSYRSHCSTADPSLPRGSDVTLVKGKVTSHQCCRDSGQGGREFLGRGKGRSGGGTGSKLHCQSQPPCRATQPSHGLTTGKGTNIPFSHEATRGCLATSAHSGRSGLGCESFKNTYCLL